MNKDTKKAIDKLYNECNGNRVKEEAWKLVKVGDNDAIEYICVKQDEWELKYLIGGM